MRSSVMRTVFVLFWLVGSVHAGEPTPSLTQTQLDVLQRLIDATPDSQPEKPDLLFRQAQLYQQQSRYYAEHPELANAEGNRNQWLLAAVRGLLAIAEHHPLYRRADEVLSDLAHELLLVHKQDAALKYFKRLVADHPRSPFVADALVAFGDHYFDGSDFANAAKFYEKVIAIGSARVGDYAKYKAGWCALELGDDAVAVERFASAARSAGEPLRREARKDLLRAYARSGDPAAARALFESIDAPSADELLDRLAEEYRAAGKREACRALARGLACDGVSPR